MPIYYDPTPIYCFQVDRFFFCSFRLFFSSFLFSFFSSFFCFRSSRFFFLSSFRFSRSFALSGFCSRSFLRSFALSRILSSTDVAPLTISPVTFPATPLRPVPSRLYKYVNALKATLMFGFADVHINTNLSLPPLILNKEKECGK